MFRLNGDIIKQLENIYEIQFISKYKNELKDRILFFLNSIIKKYTVEDYFKTLSDISTFLIIQDNKPYIINKIFFDMYKEELFNSFNPLWYFINKEKKRKYLKKDILLYFSFFVYEDNNIFKNLIGKQPNLYNFAILNPFSILEDFFQVKKTNQSIYSDFVFDKNKKIALINYIDSDCLNPFVEFLRENSIRFNTFEAFMICDKIESYLDDYFNHSKSLLFGNIIQDLLSFHFSVKVFAPQRIKFLKYNYPVSINQIIMTIYYLLKIKSELKKDL